MRTIALFCFGALLGSACGPGAPEPREYPRLGSAGDEAGARVVEREPLAEDPRIVTLRTSSPIVTIRVAFDAGSAEDPRGHEGLGNLTARLMTEGGAGELSYAELSARLFPMAARIESHVGRDQTVFIGEVHRDHLEAFYALFADVLTEPRMGADDFARIRDQSLSALTVDLRNAQDEELGKQALQWFLYRGHPYAHPALGTERGLRAIEVEDARRHREQVFCAGRATIGIGGDYDEALVDRLRADIGALRSARCLGRAVLPDPEVAREPTVLIVDKPSAQSVAVSMGFSYAITRAHDDYPALMLAAAWLGQHRQFIGRLMQEIRGERGLNYGDYAYAEHFTQEGWSRFPIPNDARRQQYFSIWLRPLRPDTAHFAIRLAVRELRRLAARGLSQEQLDRVRTFADRYFALYQQTSSRRLGYAMDDAFYGVETAYVDRLRAAWAELSLEEINAAIRRHLTPDHLQIAIVASEADDLARRIATDAEEQPTYRSSVSEVVTAADRGLVNYRLGIARARIQLVPLAEMFR